MTNIAKGKKKASATRTRNWSLIVYPDSAPADWEKIIDSWHISWARSPLHDKDINPDATDEDKKPHWHVVLLFDSVKSYEQVYEMTRVLNCPIPQQTNSIIGQIRYFIHLDNPEKYQYSKDDIVAHGNIDIDTLLKPSRSMEIKSIKQITSLFAEQNIDEFCDASDFLQEAYPDLFDIFMSHTFYFSSYLKSKFFKRMRLENEKPAETK